MAKIRSWEVSDAFWERVRPLIPVLPKRNAEKEDKRKSGGGRKPMEPRKVFEGIVYVLRTGCQWKASRKNVLAVQVRSIHTFFNG